MSGPTPITLFVYNRPEHLRKTLEALRCNDLAPQTPLTIYCDGPKQPGDSQVAAAREVAHAAHGFATLKVIEREKNLGLAASIIAGVSESFESQERVIVFEDDLVCSPHTLRFLNRVLDKYETVKTVFAGGSWTFRPELLPVPADYPYDAYFHQRFFCLGWCTWKDRWKKIDWEMRQLDVILSSPPLQQALSAQCGPDFLPMLQAQKNGILNSWAVRFGLSQFVEGAVSINPILSYLTHIGNDDSATHCKNTYDLHQNDISNALHTPKLPDIVFVEENIRAHMPNALSGIPATASPQLTEPDETSSFQREAGSALRDRAKRRIQFLRSILKRAYCHAVPSALRARVKTICYRGLNASFASTTYRQDHKRHFCLNVDPRLSNLAAWIESGKWQKAHEEACILKAAHGQIENLDLLRAQIFTAFDRGSDAYQALLEELRFYPSNANARALLEEHDSGHFEEFNDSELGRLSKTIDQYTMVGPHRLMSLYSHAKEACQNNIPGNFVECGVAAGGTSGLLSYVLAHYDTSGQRRLFSFDTFSGMPAPTSEDQHQGMTAQETGWGKGTCAGSLENLQKLLRQLGTEHLVTPVQGLFSDTLPGASRSVGPIALLHMDGDWYESTRDILMNLYDHLLPGAYVQVDDYGYWEGCQKAVDDFFAERKIAVELHPIDETGVWFKKPLLPPRE